MTNLKKVLPVGLAAATLAVPHHVLPNSGWVTFLINEEADITSLIRVFRKQDERLAAYRKST